MNKTINYRLGVLPLGVLPLGVLLLAGALLSGCTNYEARVPFTTGPQADFVNPKAELTATQTTGNQESIPSPAISTPAQAPVIPAQTQAATNLPAPLPTVVPPVRFAVIGDYGQAGRNEADVANLVLSWAPDFIVTTGDNNYPDGSGKTIDENIGQYYHSFISPYHGEFGAGADQNRFFPTLGNHDWNTRDAKPYLDYFELPGNERYYDVLWGPVHIFAIDSDSREPDGVSRRSPQAQWLKAALAASTAPWKLVVFHHSPYSSGLHGGIDWMRWPFQEWGATAVLGGHDHTYERILLDNFPYFINGIGGGAIYAFEGLNEGSQLRYNNDYGAMLITSDEAQITFEFYNRSGQLIDQYQILADQP